MINIFPSVIKTHNADRTFVGFNKTIDEKCTKLINFPPNTTIENGGIVLRNIGSNIYNSTMEIVIDGKRYIHNVKIY